MYILASLLEMISYLDKLRPAGQTGGMAGAQELRNNRPNGPKYAEHSSITERKRWTWRDTFA